MRPDRRRAPAWIGAVGLIGAPLLAAAVLLSAGPAPIPAQQRDNIAVAANARGDAAVIAGRCLMCSGRRVSNTSPLYLVVRRAGHRFARPITVTRFASGPLFDFRNGVAPAVAVSATGDVLVVWRGWNASGTLYARILHAGRWRAPAQVIGRVEPAFAEISAQLSDREGAVVFWWTSPGSSGGAGTGPTSPPVFALATAGTSGRFTPARVIDRGTSVPAQAPEFYPQFFPTSPRVAIAGEVLAWTGAQTDHPVVRAAIVRHWRLGAIQELGGGSLDQLALGPRGEALALWTREDGRLMASLAPPSGAFAPVPEQVSAADPVTGRPLVAFDPRTGRAVAAWPVPTGPAVVRVYTATRRPVAP